MLERTINTVTTVGKLKELLSSYDDNMLIVNEQLESFIHLVNASVKDKDILLLSTKKPIGTCNRTGDYVYPSIINGYTAYCPTTDEDLYIFEFTPFSKIQTII